MLQSEIIERTPSIYFRFDDQLHRGYSKSSFALDYSISNHKYIMSNKFTRDKSQHSSKGQYENINEPMSPYCDVKKYMNKQQQQQVMTINKNNNNQYIISPLSYQRHTSSNSNFHPTIQQQPRQHSNSQHQPQQQLNRLQTQDFFRQFDTKYDITFERENDVLVNQWILQVDNQGGSKISRGNLFEEELMMVGRKSMTPNHNNDNILSQNDKEQTSPSHIFQQLANQQITSSNIMNLSPTNNEMDLSRNFSHNEHQQIHTNLQQHGQRRSMGNYSSVNDKENQQQNHFGEFQEAVSFGASSNNPTKVRKYRQTNNWQYAVRDFENNSTLLEKTRPGLELKRKMPFKIIQNLMQKNSKQRQSHQTRKKPIINADLFVSTINKAEKNQIRLSKNCPNSNPVISKKSSSLQSTFCYDNMFKTNAFRETLKSTTLQNWRRKHHKKIENIVQKKTVSKKYRDTNIFDNLFIRG